MSWQTGNATDYKDLLRKLIQVASASSLSVATVAAGGTGYTVGDTLTLAGGTFSFAATVEVLTAPGGVVGTVRIKTGGAYTSTPSSPATTTGGTGSGCTITTTFASNGWTVLRQTQQAASATVQAGGTGYTVGDDITLVGGNFTTAAVFNVDSVSSGAVTAVSLVTAGNYRDKPANPVATSGGTGTGCTLNVTFAQYTGSGEYEAILQGSGGGSDTILVGFKTYQQVNGLDTAFNWTVAGFTGFNASLAFESQAGASTGALPSSSGGAYVPLHNGGSFNIPFWFSITPRRIIGVARAENVTVTHYVSWYAGWGNPFGTASEFPYPILIAGSSSRHDCLFNTTAPSITGLTEVVGINGKTGPMFYRKPDSTWQEIKNSSANDGGSPSRSSSKVFTCYPCGQTNLTGVVDDIIVGDGGFTWDDIIPPSGIPGTRSLKLKRTPMTGGDLRNLIPATICSSSTPDFDVLMELDGVFWLDGESSLTSEDTVTIANQPYRCFQNGNRNTEFSFMAIKEA